MAANRWQAREYHYTQRQETIVRTYRERTLEVQQMEQRSFNWQHERPAAAYCPLPRPQTTYVNVSADASSDIFVSAPGVVVSVHGGHNHCHNNCNTGRTTNAPAPKEECTGLSFAKAALKILPPIIGAIL